MLWNTSHYAGISGPSLRSLGGISTPQGALGPVGLACCDWFICKQWEVSGYHGSIKSYTHIKIVAL